MRLGDGNLEQAQACSLQTEPARQRSEMRVGLVTVEGQSVFRATMSVPHDPGDGPGEGLVGVRGVPSHGLGTDGRRPRIVEDEGDGGWFPVDEGDGSTIQVEFAGLGGDCRTRLVRVVYR